MLKKLGTTIILFCCVIGNVRADVSPSEPFDKFGDIYCDDEKSRLDNFAIALQQNSELRGYIIYYGGRRHNFPYGHSERLRLPRQGEATARVGRLKSYLVNSRGISADRVVLINGGYRESWTAELWIVPKGANQPTPTPTIKPQEIKFRKGKARLRDYYCTV